MALEAFKVDRAITLEEYLADFRQFLQLFEQDCRNRIIEQGLDDSLSAKEWDGELIAVLEDWRTQDERPS